MEFNLAQLHDAIAAAVPDRECIVHGTRRLSWAQVAARSGGLAGYLASRGIGAHAERDTLSGWQSGQDQVALYLYNCPQYLESMLAAFKTRAAPVNINYRYVAEELLYVLRDCGARAIVYHSSFAPTLAEVLPDLPKLQTLIQLDDGVDEPGEAERHSLLAGAVPYADAIAAGTGHALPTPRPDDLYILYTGGTTGMPKGVLWRQADIFVAALGGRTKRGEFASLDDVVARAVRGKDRVLAAPPMMHGASHWAAFIAFHGGGTVVLQPQARRFDPADVLATIERERVGKMMIVGDAFGRPLADELAKGQHDASSLQYLISSGAALSVQVKQALHELLPGLKILDAVGSSETGPQGNKLSTASSDATSGRFQLDANAAVLSAELDRQLQPGHEGMGWLAQRGRVPLGYLGDEDKTRRTFPTVGGVRYSVPGDRARLLADGTLELHGRESVTINSGGEKIFAEEVEAALKQHPAVYDAIVCGRPSERWGQEVCAVVRLRQGVEADDDTLLAEAARHIARYKLPKLILRRDEIKRSPSGKADYRWAKSVVSDGTANHRGSTP